MPIARYQLPDGRIARFEVPEGTTPEQAQQIGQDFFAKQNAQSANDAPQERPKTRVAGGRSRKTVEIPKGENIFEGLPEDVVQDIKEKTRRGGRGSGAVPVIRKRLANLEKLRQRNPDLAQLIEEMPEGEAFLIGAGHAFVDAGQGIGRLLQVLDQEDTIDKEFDILAGIKSSAQGGDLAAETAMFAVPGSIATKATKLATPLAVGTGALEGAVSEAGDGGSKGDIITATIAGSIGGGLSTDAFTKTKMGNKVREIIERSRAAKTPKQGPAPASAAQQQIKDKISEGSTESVTARYIIDGTGKLKKDKVGQEALRQGFDEGVIAAVKGSTKKDKGKMLAMLSRVERGKKDARFGAVARPSDVVGDSVMQRFKEVRKINQEAGRELGVVARRLKGQPADFTSAVDDFVESLDDLGVTIGDNLVPNFKGSEIERIPGARRVIKNVVERMSRKTPADAFEGHRLKKFIDEQVDFNKSQGGLSGRAESIVKSLRHNIDQVLDNTFPDYKQVNDTFAESISALDDFQKAAGTSLNLNSPNVNKSIGTVSRRLLGNAQSRVALMDSINDMQEVAARHGAKFDDDVITQALFIDELERMFGPATRTSLQGDVDKVVQRASEASRGNLTGVAVDAVSAGANKLRGISEENAIKTLKKLLKEAA